MISIIICSRTPSISSDLIDNINKTIGVQYELICIDNSTMNSFKNLEDLMVYLDKNL